ncbi:Clp protease N-terminal domain-containing protein [Amycolatopsis sp. NPDC051903]|uniref:Clp protease N-terminal domain-containing protein n=1 Tax=Amycolatopsis sp. NPDC051903 TaxID=3363936 RepID=UPI0037AA61AD
MFERFTPEARTVVVHAQEHARRLGHHHVGCEHLLLAVASAGEPAGAVLRERGSTPDRVEEEIVRRVGLGGGAGLFGDLDRDALAAVGVDLDAVRARIVASFGADAVAQAAGVVHHKRRPRLNLALPSGLLRRRRRRLLAAAVPGPAATGHYRAEGPVPRGHLPLTTAARDALAHSVEEAQARRDQHIGVEHLALGLIGMNGGLVRPILEALGTSGPAVRAGILDRYRRAS